jgi:adenylate cyclase
MQRRLSAILAADVVGYSRLMGANEVGTLQSLQTHQAELIEPEIAARQGRIVKLTGDGILAEFPSVVGAVECATAIQRAMPGRNVDVPEDRRIEFRIGINLGDVIVEGEDLFGDGVNVAARLESVARPGGIAVSQSVCEHIGNKLDLIFRDRGEEQLKNIDRPVRVYDVVFEARTAKAGAVADVREEKPSIAVLPFNNLSGDPQDDYFSEGITEDIITDLSKVSGIFVLGRHTSFAYKGKSENLERVATDLGVKFLLEGSVRKAGNRIRITGQLIDGASGGHLWAERYDRDLTDIFAIQDEITRTIVDQLKVRLVPAENSAIGQQPTESVEAYNFYLKGRQFFHNATKNFLRLARHMFVRAVELDPLFARAYAGIANCDCRLVGWYAEPIAEEQILSEADRALELDPHLSEAHAARGEALFLLEKYAEAEAEFEEAIRLDPNSFEANFLYARYWKVRGKSEKAVDYYVRALEVQPDDPQAPLLLQLELRNLGRVEEADKYAWMGIRRAEEAVAQHPEWSRPAQLAGAALANLGERAKAIDWIERALAVDPDDNLALYNAACTYAQLRENEQAIEILQRWAPNAGIEKKLWLRYDTDFDPIREDPRFQHLVQELAPAAM